ncbi:MAG: hypothetical protein ACRDV9_13925 [Acidimicrobiia bacterium]
MTSGSSVGEQTTTDDEPLTRSLDEVAEAAEETALEQTRLARRARSMSRQRRLGRSWAEILQRERQPGILALLARGARRLQDVSGRFRYALGKALIEEGLSTRQVAKEFGVTHQRISAMLNRRNFVS